MSKPDGVIRFRTEADNSELEKQLEDAKKKVESVEGKIKELNKDRTSAINAQRKAQEKLTKAQEEYNAAVEKQKAAQEKVDAARDTLAAAEGRRKELVYDINASRNAAEKTRLSNELNQQVDAVIQARAELEAAESAATYDDAVASAAQNVDAAAASLREAETAVNNIDESISSANSELDRAKDAAGELENNLRASNNAVKEIKKPIDAAEKSISRFTNRISRIIATSLVFSVIRSGINQLKTYYGDILKKNKEFSAQLSKLKGAFYAAFQPIYEYAIPALTSLMKIFTAALQVVGVFFSELTGKSYSQMLENAKALYEQANATEELGDAAEKAKKSIAGFDELNIISTGNEAENETNDIMPDFSSVDVDIGSWSEKLRPIANIVGEIAGAVESMSEGILIILGAVAVGKMYKTVKKTWQNIKNLKITKMLKGAQGEVTGIGIAASALAGYFEFSTIKDAVTDLALDCEGAAGKVASIGVAATAAAAVMYTALGPYGIAVAALVGLAAAVSGVTAAQEKMMEQMADESFYSGTGTKISELGKAFEDIATKISKPFETLSDSVDDVVNSKSALEETSEKIGGILQAFKDGYEPTSDEVDSLKELFEDLRDSAKETMSATYDYLYNAVTGALSGALADAGSSSAEVLAVLKKLRGEVSGELEKLDAEFESIWSDYESGAISTDKFTELAQPILDRINALNGISTEIDVSKPFEELLADVGNIDWENEEQVAKFFETLSSAATSAKDTISTATDGIMSAMKDAANQARVLGYDDLANYLETTIGTSAEKAANSAYADLEGYLNKVYTAIQKDIILKSQNQEKELTETWNDYNWFQKWFAGSENAFVRKGLETYQEEVIDPLTEKIKESMEDLGVDGSAWASDAMAGIIDSAYEVVRDAFSPESYEYLHSNELSEAIEKAFDNLGVSGSDDAADAGEEIAKSFKEALENGLKGTYFGKISYELDPIPGHTHGTFASLNLNVPALAGGSVLPANHPFLAMVGDQKHGTNVEAPLSTIQEAVALVMEDNTNGMMAGFEALVAEVQQLRAAVEGIEVGDSTIGQAANRYNQRMAIIRG